MRIELTTSAWKAEVLPLNYTRKWRETESNRRHMELQSIALPTELPSQRKRGCGIRTHARFYPPDGFQDRSLQPDLGNPPKSGSCWIRTNDRSVMSREL
jgi:hypothetical protein